jgi:glycerate kinase
MERMTPEQWPFLKSFNGQILPALPPIYIACDVDNPLLGPSGAAAIYGPQKGLLAEEIDAYDQMCAQMADQLCDFFQSQSSIQTLPGSGAAGGIGFGLQLGCQAQLVPGFPLVAAWLELDARIQQADLILTGEGKFDKSSLDGKGPYALIQSADKHHKQALLFAGTIDPDAADQVQLLHTNCALYSISPDGDPLEKALFEAPGNLQHKVTEMIQHCYPI